MGPVKWTYFYLYVILDIFGRRVIGWHIADAETRRAVSTSLTCP
jgi:putative transposase